jgi:glycosyltransferase involved in cell wall biosynthesis
VAGLEWAPTFFAVASAAFARKPAIATVHTNLDRYRDLEPVPGIWWPAMRRALRRCVTVVAVSEDVRASVVRLGIDDRRIRVIPNPVRQINPQPRASASRTAKILTVAGLRRMKGVDVALEAAAKLADCDFLWTIVGDGPERDSLQRRARQLSLDGKVEFVGFQPEPTEFYQSADLFVLPSRVEGSSMALLEAMSAGLPVVATRCAAAVEQHLAGCAGELVPIDDAEAIAMAIRSLLADTRRWAEMGEAGRVRARAFRPEAVAACYDDLFAEVLAGSAARRRRKP